MLIFALAFLKKQKIQSNVGIILFCTEPVFLKADIGEKYRKTRQNILQSTQNYVLIVSLR